MAQQNQASDQSMDEILASIRKIISDDVRSEGEVGSDPGPQPATARQSAAPSSSAPPSSVTAGSMTNGSALNGQSSSDSQTPFGGRRPPQNNRQPIPAPAPAPTFGTSRSTQAPSPPVAEEAVSQVPSEPVTAPPVVATDDAVAAKAAEPVSDGEDQTSRLAARLRSLTQPKAAAQTAPADTTATQSAPAPVAAPAVDTTPPRAPEPPIATGDAAAPVGTQSAADPDRASVSELLTGPARMMPPPPEVLIPEIQERPTAPATASPTAPPTALPTTLAPTRATGDDVASTIRHEPIVERPAAEVTSHYGEPEADPVYAAAAEQPSAAPDVPARPAEDPFETAFGPRDGEVDQAVSSAEAAAPAQRPTVEEPKEPPQPAARAADRGASALERLRASLAAGRGPVAPSADGLGALGGGMPTSRTDVVEKVEPTLTMRTEDAAASDAGPELALGPAATLEASPDVAPAAVDTSSAPVTAGLSANHVQTTGSDALEAETTATATPETSAAEPHMAAFAPAVSGPADAPIGAASTEDTSAASTAVIANEPTGAATRYDPTFEEVVTDMLRPMMRDWLDKNMERITAKVLADEIERRNRGEDDA